jgi:hypothetical protein
MGAPALGAPTPPGAPHQNGMLGMPPNAMAGFPAGAGVGGGRMQMQPPMLGAGMGMPGAPPQALGRQPSQSSMIQDGMAALMGTTKMEDLLGAAPGMGAPGLGMVSPVTGVPDGMQAGAPFGPGLVRQPSLGAVPFPGAPPPGLAPGGALAPPVAGLGVPPVAAPQPPALLKHESAAGAPGTGQLDARRTRVAPGAPPPLTDAEVEDVRGWMDADDAHLAHRRQTEARARDEARALAGVRVPADANALRTGLGVYPALGPAWWERDPERPRPPPGPPFTIKYIRPKEDILAEVKERERKKQPRRRFGLDA